jgi:hypothetical protein
MARLTRRAAAISDEETSDVDVPKGTLKRSGRPKAGVKYTEPQPLELEEDEDMDDVKAETNGDVKEEDDDDEEGEDGEEPEE